MNKSDLLFLLWGVYNMACSHDNVEPTVQGPAFFTKYSFLYDRFQEAIQEESVNEFKNSLNED